MQIAAVVTGALVLLALIVCRSLPIAIAESNPQLAMRFNASSSQDLLVFPTEELAKTESAISPAGIVERRERLRDSTIAALEREPFSARGLEILGQIAIDAGDVPAADRYFQAAAKYSLRRPIAQFWLAQRALAKRNYSEAAHHTDVLLRNSPQAIPLLAPLLVRLIETPAARDAIVKVLSQNPPWRQAFFAHLRTRLTVMTAPLRVFHALQSSSYPPTDKEISSYIRLLIDKRHYDLAYSAWLQFLPADKLPGVAWLFNGRFSFPSSGLPFDWSISRSRGAVVDILPTDNSAGGYALTVKVGPGRVDFQGVRQTLALPAGRYTLSGLFKGRLHGTRGFRWSVGCSDRAEKIGETAMFIGDTPQWSQFSAALDVPPNCPLQTIKLVLDARSESETFVSGTIAFTGLAVSKS